jgi:hypothetical protein
MTGIDVPLFDDIPDSDRPTPEPVEKISPDRRRTLKQRALLDAGIHPLTRAPLLPAEHGLTCGDCWRFDVHEWRNRTYFKCELNVTHGAATDIRKSWPACTRYLPPPDQEDPDA